MDKPPHQDTFSRDMYKEHILDLFKEPLNYGVLKDATYSHREFNPLCGDDITIALLVKNGKVVDVKFTGKGCAISTASASLLTEHLKGLSLAEAKKITSGKILSLLEIDIGPVRMKCALLPLVGLQHSIGEKNES